MAERHDPNPSAEALARVDRWLATRDAEPLSDRRDIALMLDAAREEGRRDALAATCLRAWYHPLAQEDRVCRLPRGHAPEEHGCVGEPAEEDDDG